MEENFDYPVGDMLTAHGWTAHSGTTHVICVTQASIACPGYPPSGVGNETSLVASGQDVNHTFASRSTGDVYIAFLVKVVRATLPGDYFLHLGKNPVGSSFKGKVFVRRDGSNHLSFGVSQSSKVTAMISYSPFIYSLNTTYLLVLKYSILPGPGNDVACLFSNPDVNLPEPVLRLTSYDTPGDPDEIGSVALRQGSETGGADLKIDGIRAGITWEDLFAGIPEQLTVTGTVAAGQSVCYDAYHTISVAGGLSVFYLSANGNATLIAGQNIRFYPGSRVRTGGQLYASITQAGNYCQGASFPMEMFPSRETENKLMANETGYGGPGIFPNPTHGPFVLEWNDQEGEIRGFATIYRITGELISRKELVPGLPPKFDLSSQPAGIYLMQIADHHRTQFLKIIKQ